MEPIEMRVERSLKRLGFPRVRVFRINPRRIKLVGQIGPSDEPAIAFAVARTVAGVIEVQNKIVVGERQDFVGQQAERSKTRDFTQPWPAVRTDSARWKFGDRMGTKLDVCSKRK